MCDDVNGQMAILGRFARRIRDLLGTSEPREGTVGFTRRQPRCSLPAMREFHLADGAAVDAALDADRFLIFKNSDRCAISRDAFSQYEAFASGHPQLLHGWVDVVGQRALSNRIAEMTGVTHRSPQAIWIVDGRVAWHASHFDITEDALARAVNPDAAE